MLVTQSSFVGWKVEWTLKLLCDQKDRLGIEWERAITPVLKKGIQTSHFLSSTLGVQIFLYPQFHTYYRNLYCSNYYFFFPSLNKPTYSLALSHQYGVKHSVASWGRHKNQILPAHKQGKREVLGNRDYWKPKKVFFTWIQANIKIKTLPEVWNSFLFTPKPELRQALVKSQSRSSKRLANLRKFVPDLRLIPKIINLMIFAQLWVDGKTEQNLQVKGTVAPLKSLVESGRCAR